MILLIDNFDSFVHNLARYIEELGHVTRVVRANAVAVADVAAMRPEAIVISPGPCDPPRAGISLAVVRTLGGRIPILGVCLGHQVIAEAYGARVVRGTPVHGRADHIHHSGTGLFQDLPSPFLAGRYHSLVVSPDGLPVDLEVTARTPDGTVMGLRHRRHLVSGVQFHPESILTEHGHALLLNFLRHVAPT